MVTIDLDTLRDWMRHGCPPDWATRADKNGATGKGRGGGAGSCLSGDVLTAATVRRMACDAAIIPAVLGSDSQPLDVGRQERLVTRPIRTALWHRDQGCSFPGCSMPAQWTDAHHVQHWLHGGQTNLANLALLCRRHHVHVPRQTPHRHHHRHHRHLAHLATLAHHLHHRATNNSTTRSAIGNDRASGGIARPLTRRSDSVAVPAASTAALPKGGRCPVGHPTGHSTLAIRPVDGRLSSPRAALGFAAPAEPDRQRTRSSTSRTVASMSATL